MEDASESLGTAYKSGKYKGKHTGTIGKLGCLSFNGNKIITTGGGGMILTNEKKLADKARYLTTQAKDDPVRYIHDEIGYNFRLTNIQAALGVAQLEQLTEFLERKKIIYKQYVETVDKICGLTMAQVTDYADNNHWMNLLQGHSEIHGEDRDVLMQRLEENGIQTRPVWGQMLNYFVSESGGTKASSALDQSYYRLYGGGVGGPIVRNRTFWWFASEGYRSFTQRHQQQIWPGVNQRTGDFSKSTISGTATRLWNPWCRGLSTATTKCPATGSGSIATPEFTNADMSGHAALSPVALAITALWPTKTISGKDYSASQEDGTQNVADNSQTIDKADMYTFKMEHKFSDDWSLSGMYLYNSTDEPSYSYILPGTAKSDYFSSSGAWYLERRPHVLVMNNTNILNDTTVLTTRYGWTRWLDNTTPGTYAPGAAGLGFDSSFTSALESELGQHMIHIVDCDLGEFRFPKKKGKKGRSKKQCSRGGKCI